MEASFLNTHFHILAAPVVPNKIKNLALVPNSSFPRPHWQPRMTVTAWCTGQGSGPVSEVERELASEGEDMGRWMEKCGGQGVVELLECLEREAIMGEDEGKEPCDYNRRARIFDRSSRVFQALRESKAKPSPRP